MDSPLDPFSGPFWTTVGVAVLCGTIVGLERQLRGKPAGVRTSTLICLGTAVFVHLGALVGGGGTDPTRVLGQIVTGIGFLGAGVIMKGREAVYGVTTAAVIWVLASIGAAIGFGYYKGAVFLSIVTVVVLTGIEFLESRVRGLTRGVYERREERRK